MLTRRQLPFMFKVNVSCSCVYLVHVCTAYTYDVLASSLPSSSSPSNSTVDVYFIAEMRQFEKEEVTEGTAPKFVIPLEDTHFSSGSTIELQCKLTGEPFPTIKWSVLLNVPYS